jgi:ribosome-binding factor A
MGTLRIQRVNELLKRELGEIIRREISVSEYGLIAVNDVQTAPDLHTAQVFVGVLGRPEQRQRALEILAEQRKHIQSILARSVVLKFTPQLRFTLDDSVERGNRILALIEQLEHEEPKPPQP